MTTEEDVFSQNELTPTHSITNGADSKAKINKKISLIREFKHVMSLAYDYSFLYLVKFLFFVIFVVPVACIAADSHHTLLMSSFTFLGSLLFDQMVKKKFAENFDYEKIETFCKWMTLYIIAISMFVLLLLGLENQWLYLKAEDEVFITLSQFKVVTFFILFSSSFSALIEAIVNIPEAALPSRQQKGGTPKAGIGNNNSDYTKGEEEK